MHLLFLIFMISLFCTSSSYYATSSNFLIFLSGSANRSLLWSISIFLSFLSSLCCYFESLFRCSSISLCTIPLDHILSRIAFNFSHLSLSLSLSNSDRIILPSLSLNTAPSLGRSYPCSFFYLVLFARGASKSPCSSIFTKNDSSSSSSFTS